MLYYQEKWNNTMKCHSSFCPCQSCIEASTPKTEYQTFMDAVTEIDGILKRSELNDETVLALYKTRQALMLLKARF